MFSKKVKWLVYTILFLLVIAVALKIVFYNLQMSDDEIKSYYSNKKYIPHFKVYHVDGIPVHYAEMGNDTLPLLIFIHGAPGAWYGYINMFDDSLLRQNFKIISVDRPGYGKSGTGNSVISLDEQARLLQPILNEYKMNKPVILVGRSFGAPVAAKLASENQDKIIALFLLGADIDPEKEKFWWFSPLGNFSLFRWILTNDMIVANEEKYSRVSELKKLLLVWQKIKIPVIMMHGENDWIVDTTNMAFAKRMLINSPKSKFMLLPGVGHVISNEQPDLLIIEILKSL
jgi:pimeloyl-ACP methyl ester carboxylesterase